MPPFFLPVLGLRPVPFKSQKQHCVCHNIAFAYFVYRSLLFHKHLSHNHLFHKVILFHKHFHTIDKIDAEGQVIDVRSAFAHFCLAQQ